jgi:hypothetical protein
VNDGGDDGEGQGQQAHEAGFAHGKDEVEREGQDAEGQHSVKDEQTKNVAGAETRLAAGRGRMMLAHGASLGEMTDPRHQNEAGRP